MLGFRNMQEKLEKVNFYMSLKHFMFRARGHGLFLVRIRERINLPPDFKKSFENSLSGFFFLL